MNVRRRRKARPLFTAAELETLRKRTENGQPSPLERLTCNYCGGLHAEKCPRVRRIEFQPNSDKPAAVEFFDWGKWPEDRVLWPDQLTIPEEETTS